MSTNHTPEPWIQQYDDNGFYEVIGTPHGLLAFTTGEGATDEANAKRIVACVNYCAGEPTEEIEAATLRSVLNKMGVIAKQRDELLAALKLAKEWLEGWASAEPQLKFINAAIAKAEGKP